MTSSSAYTVLFKIHKANLDDIASKISRAHELLEKEKQSILVLESYIQEYKNDFMDPSKCKSLLAIRSQGNFIKKLHVMIDAQNNKVLNIEGHIKDLNNKLLEENIQVKKYEKLIENENTKTRIEMEKIEAKISDEVNTNSGFRKK